MVGICSLGRYSCFLEWSMLPGVKSHFMDQSSDADHRPGTQQEALPVDEVQHAEMAPSSSDEVERRSATLVATAPTEVAWISRHVFDDLLDNNPHLKRGFGEWALDLPSMSVLRDIFARQHLWEKFRRNVLVEAMGQSRKASGRVVAARMKRGRPTTLARRLVRILGEVQPDDPTSKDSPITTKAEKSFQIHSDLAMLASRHPRDQLAQFTSRYPISDCNVVSADDRRVHSPSLTLSLPNVPDYAAMPDEKLRPKSARSERSQNTKAQRPASAPAHSQRRLNEDSSPLFNTSARMRNIPLKEETADVPPSAHPND